MGRSRDDCRATCDAQHASQDCRLADTEESVSFLDTAHEAGYVDQPRLTRSLRQLIGQTPAPIVRGDEQLSFLFKTEGGRCAYDRAWS